MRIRDGFVLGVWAFLLSACGGSPNTPAPVPQPSNPPPNNVPVIEAVTARGTRAKAPSGFANLADSFEVTATVRDDETAVDQLQYNWSAPVGTFTGTGPRVTWQAPAEAAATPLDVALRVEVVERYGGSFEHRVSSTISLRLHDSIKEVGDMARQFLLDFSDSSIRDVSYIMRNFDPTCYGTADEASQVEDNRRSFRINSSFVGAATVTVNFGGLCPIRARPGDACALIPVRWSSTRLSNGATETVQGTDQVAAVYKTDLREWRLCDSQFDGALTANMRGFIR